MDTASLFSYVSSSTIKTKQTQSKPKRRSQRPTSYTTHSSSRSAHSSQVVVQDEFGNNVTPLSLLSLRPSALQQHTLLMNSEEEGHPSGQNLPNSFNHQEDFERRSVVSVAASAISWSDHSSVVSDSSSARATPRTARELSEESLPIRVEVTHPKEDSLKVATQILNEKDLLAESIESSGTVHLFLDETPTIWLLDIPGGCVEKDGPLANSTISSNEDFKRRVLRKKIQNESFVERGVQTFHFPPKHKDSQASTPKQHDSQCTATDWDIFDSFSSSGNNKTKRGDGLESVSIMSNLEQFDVDPGSWLDLGGNNDSRNEKSLVSSLRMMERIASQNVYHDKHLYYRGITSSNKNTPSIQLLWAFSCPLSQEKKVQCMTWNPTKKDVLAVAYSASSNSKEEFKGLVLCWSLKSPEFPERVLRLSQAATSMDFSRIHSNLLAIGMQDGSISIYDLQFLEPKLVLDSRQSDFRHMDPVWALQWVDRGDERGECLVSVSSDGKVVQWSTKKGLEHTELMKLKRVNSKIDQKNEALVSRQARGLCLDFASRDSNVYIVGTEDGSVHKCSCSYNEQGLDVYSHHSGPVYKVVWSPFYNGAFLSCSADWTIKLWDDNQSDRHHTPQFTFESESNSVNDTAWSPSCSTLFAAVNGNGQLEIWDLDSSILDPIVTSPTSTTPNRVLFSENCPVVVVGTQGGQVEVWNLLNFKSENRATGKKSRLEEIIHPTK